jgi:hypothetical protein
MRRNRGTALAVSFIALLVLFALGCSDGPPPLEPEPEAPPPDPVPEVVARIGDDIAITRDDYLRELDYTRRMIQAQLYLVSQTSGQPAQQLAEFDAGQRAEVLRVLVNKRVLDLLAQRAGVTVDEEAIDARVREGRAQLIDDESYADYLRWFQMTEDQLREEIRQTLVRDKYFELNAGDCTVTDDDVRDEYERLKRAGQMSGPDVVDFRQILASAPLGSDEAVWEEAKQKLLKARERILAGEPFETVAVEVSDDPRVVSNKGYLPGIGRDIMAPAVEEAMFSVPIGELSGPIRTSYGWHIIRVERRLNAGIRPIEAVAEDIRASLVEQCNTRHAQALLDQAHKDLDVRVLYDPTVQ